MSEASTEPVSSASSRPKRDRIRSEKAIRAAAEACFVEFGYENATIRRIAERAKVNPSLVIQYFGSKARLFAEVVSIDQPVLQSLHTTGRLGTSVAETFIALYEGDRPWVQTALSLFRSAPTQPEAAEILRAAINERSIETFAEHLDSADAQQRSAVIGAVILGIVYGRHLLDLEHLNTADLPRLVHYTAAAINGVLDVEDYQPAAEDPAISAATSTASSTKT